MDINIILNGDPCTLKVQPNELLMHALRQQAMFSVKHGCETGECGNCIVLVDGKPTPTCMILAAQANGKSITTLESLATGRSNLHPLQQAFVETGAIQCGYCTPAQIMCAKALIDKNPQPSEPEVRSAIAGVLCRCTGYVKPVEAIMRAAATLRGEEVEPVANHERAIPAPPDLFGPRHNADDMPLNEGFEMQTQTRVKPMVLAPTEIEPTTIVGKSEPKVDAIKLALGKPVFTDDLEMRGMLYGALKTSPHAHARIVKIDASQAQAIPGVHAVLTYQDIERVLYASGGQSYPNPKPWDQVSLDNKVRHV
ncbi:MAG: 2Fe-2S iron-sulfur cluster-binding protein, partial [Chloroflexota bacterium]